MAKIRLLLVDDMEWAYEFAKLQFSEKCIIDYARTENEALQKIKNNNYDIILTDYHLGEDAPEGGINIVRAAKKKGLQVILMSKESHRKEAEKEGVEFIFKKNFPASVKSHKSNER